MRIPVVLFVSTRFVYAITSLVKMPLVI